MPRRRRRRRRHEEEPIAAAGPRTVMSHATDRDAAVTQRSSEEDMLRGDESRIQIAARDGFRGTPTSYPCLGPIRSSFGRHDVSSIQAFTDSKATGAAQRMGAAAYASGNSVAFRRTPSLHTAAHEAAHIIQQRQGVQLKGGIGKKGDIYERHADAVADRVVQGKSAEDLLSLSPGGSSIQRAVQLQAPTNNPYLGAFWDAYVNNNKPTGLTPKQEEAWKLMRQQGKQVRSFQKYSNRKVSTKGGKKVIEVDSSTVDKAEGATVFADSESSSRTAPNTWHINVVSYDLFDGSPKVADVVQGNVGDCFLLATLQSLASTGGGRGKIRSMTKQSGSGFQVEFYRLKVFGKKAIVDPNARIRVSVTQKAGAKGARAREVGPIPLTGAALAPFIARNPGIKKGDLVTGSIQKRIIWPWVVEKAFASVLGSYSGLEGGGSDLPMMVITGDLAARALNIKGRSAADITTLFTVLQTHLSTKIGVADSHDPEEMKKNFARDFGIHSADPGSGVKITTAIDPGASAWIPWATFLANVKSYNIIDWSKLVKGQKGAVRGNKNFKDHQKAIIAASKQSWTTITGKFNDGLWYGKGKWVGSKHSYSIASATPSTISLNNPWGRLHLTMSDSLFPKAFSRVIITL